MNSEEKILDSIEKEPIEIVKTDHRAFKDLTIVIGVIYLILGFFLSYTVYNVISWKIELVGIMGYGWKDINWFKLIGQSSPGLSYTICFFVGAIGLFCRSTWGWTVSLIISTFALIFPFLVDLIRTGSSPKRLPGCYF